MSTAVSLLGATGSIGRSALAVLDRHPDRFRVVALSANTALDRLAGIAERHRPELAVMADPDALRGASPPGAERWRGGREALLEAAAHPDADIVINAVVGAAGLEASLAALEAGKRLALANKESLVVGGPLIRRALRECGGELVPVDSEHSAILQCLHGAAPAEVRRLILTASGGPFRGWGPDALAEATPDQALDHPTWEMGAKITIDSATLANKALEVIEAHVLFDVDYERIETVIHPQSIIHSMVDFADGSVLAQLGFPTMELPILYALTHPERVADAGTRFDPVAAGPLTFEPLDPARAPCFRLGTRAGRAGGTAPAVFNAANEQAVAAFLEGAVPFPAIAGVIEHTLAARPHAPADSLEAVLAADRQARSHARERIEELC